MIRFIESSRAFVLSGSNYSYVMYVNQTGSLQHAYYGKKIEDADVDFIIKTHCECVSLWPNDALCECGSFGRQDYRAPTVIINRKDGARMSHFSYVSHSIIDGVIKIDGMPCIRNADQTLTVTVKDDFSSAEIDLNYSVYDDSATLVRNMVIRNVGDEAIDLSKAFSFCVDLPDMGNYSALRLVGKWAKERIPCITPISNGTLRIETTEGYSSHDMNPFLGILIEDCSETHGVCYGFNLIYSGSHAFTAEVNMNNRLRIQGGINDTAFGWRIEGGDKFVTPQVACVYSENGLGDMSRSYHDFYRKSIVNPKYAYAHRPIVINNWEGTYFDFDNEKLFAIIDAAKDTGIDTFVLDDGWFGNRCDDRRGLGDWFVNEEKLKGGLKAVIDRCKQNGLKFGLWFEPEMVSEDSDLYRAHPDWAIKKEGIQPCYGRNQLILDFTKPDVVNYIYGLISKVLSENDISYVKWDKNREMSEFFTTSLPADRQGEFAHRYTLGFYNLAERLTSAFPDVFFEGCAGGGGRFDGGALYYFPQIWTSDDTDGLERTKIQWGTSICYPVSAMSCHVSACPNHQTQRITPFATRGAIASLGATGYELDLAKLGDDEKRQVKEQVANYKRIDDLVLEGDLYRISDPFVNNYFAEMLVAKDKSKAYVVGERFRADPCDSDRIIKLQGLDENKLYHIEELDMTASGRALMNVGLLYPRLNDCGSWTWILVKVK